MEQAYEIICLATFVENTPFKWHDLRGITRQSQSLRLSKRGAESERTISRCIQGRIEGTYGRS
jgi:hypothetical protein